MCFLLFQLYLLHACGNVLHIVTHSFAFRSTYAVILALFMGGILDKRKMEKSIGEKFEDLLFYL